MHTLYNSETYSVTHMLANAESDGKPVTSAIKTEQFPEGVPLMARHGFELLEVSNFETKAGRDSILSFAFRRHRWPR